MILNNKRIALYFVSSGSSSSSSFFELSSLWSDIWSKINYSNYLVVESGTPGALPKWSKASLNLEPLSKVTYCPLGLSKANWSKVKHSPPASTILLLAVSVNLKAATLILPKLFTLKSFVIVPTQAKIGSFLLK